MSFFGRVTDATLRYGLAMAAIGVALIARAHLISTGVHAPFALLLGAVFLTALIAGQRAGLLATLLGALAEAFYEANSMTGVKGLVLMIFMIEGIVMSGLIEKYRSRDKDAEAKIRYHELHDSLTDLPLKDLFMDSLKSLSKKNARIGVISLDIDEFREINETAGHELGDELLIKIADRLSEFFSKDAVVARFGGDKFLIGVPSPIDESIPHTLQDLLKKLKEPVDLNGFRFHVTSSIGFASYPDSAENMSDLIRNAEIAMRHVKETGKNGCRIFTKKMGDEFTEKVHLSHEIKSAIQKGQFEVYYQPIVNTDTGEIETAEALVRWNHPKKGLLTPGSFIPLAEKSGSILELDEWIFESACKKAKEWQSKGHNLKISINLSAHQFARHDLISKIGEILKSTGADPSKIQFEISESAALRDADQSRELMLKLKELGFLLAIDDFGTGYASLSYLSKFPANTVKIDRSFVRDSVKNPTSRTIMKAIVDLSRALGMSYLAEGVETKEELRMVRELECPCIQGFIASKPIKAKDFEEILSKSTPFKTLAEGLS